jgi:hypothetical protein
MATKEEIRAVFADPPNDGMEALYHCIGEMLQDGAEFENTYSLVIAAGDRYPSQHLDQVLRAMRYMV